MIRRHDYRCSHCGHVAYDVLVPDKVSARELGPECPNCSTPDEIVLMMWAPSTKAMDVGGVKGAAFKAITVYDGRSQPVLVDSLHKLRQVERDSEQRERDGEGQKMVWRDYSQDSSNKDIHTLTGFDPDRMSDPHGVQEAIARGKKKFPKASGEDVIAQHGTIPAEE